MRIALNTPDPQASATEKAKKAASNLANTEAAERVQEQQDSSEDRVTLSALATQAMATPEVRQEKVEALRHSVSNGEYKPDSNESAEAMLER